jgi:hypothetical protein
MSSAARDPYGSQASSSFTCVIRPPASADQGTVVVLT